MEELCDIVLTDPMASTVKLHALRAIDSLLDYPQGLERFLGWSKPSSVPPLPPTAYQHMLSLLINQPVSTLLIGEWTSQPMFITQLARCFGRFP